MRSSVHNIFVYYFLVTETEFVKVPFTSLLTVLSGKNSYPSQKYNLNRLKDQFLRFFLDTSYFLSGNFFQERKQIYIYIYIQIRKTWHGYISDVFAQYL